jgi:hypothetical protein
MITTDNIIELIKDYRGHATVFLNEVRRGNGDDLWVWKKLKSNKEFYEFRDELLPGIEFLPDDEVIYFGCDEKEKDVFMWSVYVYELIDYIREIKLEKLLD